MIKSFVHKGLEKFFTSGNMTGIQAKHANKLHLILAQLNQSTRVEDMDIPSPPYINYKVRKKTFGRLQCKQTGASLFVLKTAMLTSLIMKIIIERRRKYEYVQSTTPWQNY